MMNAQQGILSDSSGDGSALTPGVRPVLREALREARQQLEALYGSRLRRVVLYGSQARGDARPKGHPSGESDVDVLVVLRGGADGYAEFKRLSALKMDLFERYRLTFSLIPYDEKAYQDTHRPFAQSVRAEGIELPAENLPARKGSYG